MSTVVYYLTPMEAKTQAPILEKRKKKEIVAEGREAAERTGGAREGQGGPNGVPGWHPRPDTRGR
jgi:hypothetical protein